jgi:two-component system LytT family sensor kinase
VFKHTVERRRGPVHVVVSASRAGGALVLGVEDDVGRLAPPFAPSPDQGPGIGLPNLRARLLALYGGAAVLELSERAGGGVRAELRLPCLDLPCVF